MAIVGQAKRYDIPHEPGEWMELRPLSGLEQDDVKEARSTKVLAKVAKIDPETLEALRASRTEVDDNEPDPATAYDMEKTALLGVRGWSYPVECSHESIKMLDKKTLEWAVRKIVGMTERTEGEDSGSEPF